MKSKGTLYKIILKKSDKKKIEQKSQYWLSKTNYVASLPSQFASYLPALIKENLGKW